MWSADSEKIQVEHIYLIKIFHFPFCKSDEKMQTDFFSERL